MGLVLTVDEDHIPLFDALLAEDAGEGLDLVEELLVRDPLLGFGDGAVVQDGGQVAVAGVDMAVDAVVAGRYLAIWEPLPVVVGLTAPQRLRPPREDRGRLLMPVQVLGLVGPETLRVTERVVLNFVLWVIHLVRTWKTASLGHHLTTNSIHF